MTSSAFVVASLYATLVRASSVHLRFSWFLGPPHPARAVVVLRPWGEVAVRLQPFPRHASGGGVQILKQRRERFPAGREAGVREGLRESRLLGPKQGGNALSELVQHGLQRRPIGGEHNREVRLVVAFQGRAAPMLGCVYLADQFAGEQLHDMAMHSGWGEVELLRQLRDRARSAVEGIED